MRHRSSLLVGIVFFVSLSLIAQPGTNGKHDPPPGPGHYELAEGIEFPVRIPFRMHFGKPLLDLEINGWKATLMIDNGVLWDQVWLFGSPLVEELQLKPLDDSSLEGAGRSDPAQAYTSSDLEISFGDITFHEQSVLVSPAVAGFARMFPGADGQLSNTFFRHFIVEFDFISSLVILHHPDRYVPGQEAKVLPMKLNESGTHAVPFSLTTLEGRDFKDWVDIDFGGIYALKIALNTRHRIEAPAGVEPVAGLALPGRSQELKGEIQRMTLGSFTFERPVVYFGDETTSRIHPDNLGVIGLPLFMRFKTVFDYFNNRLILEPNEFVERPFR